MPRPAKPAQQETPDLDVTDPDIIAALAHIELAGRTGKAIYGEHPWPFIRDCVRTLDEVGGKETVKRAPQKAYVEHVANAWVKNPLLIIPKTRRMWMTWLLLSLNYWLFRTQPNAFIAFCARKEGKTENEGSNQLVKRAHFIHEHLLPLAGDFHVDYHTGQMQGENGSIILSVGQGKDQLRQYTCTSILADEFQSWEWAYDTYVAMKPTIDGGGRVTIVGSAGPGMLEQLVFDSVK